MSPQNNQAALASLNGARPILAHFDQPRSAEDLAADIIDLWTGVEAALQTLVGNSSLSGQQLIRAARQAEVITLDQAHSLLEFLAARDRANRTSYKPTQADGDAAVDGFKALESGLSGARPSTSSASRPTPSSPLQAACPILHLAIGPVDLNLLGLGVRLGGGSDFSQPIVLDLTAHRARGCSAITSAACPASSTRTIC